ncbi:MAG TPA: SURF1 family protein, partial [Actinomycetota bacterium]|nr:SURF1 family protein [Actinomycetota bacterium]
MYSSLFRPRWVLGHAVVLAVVVACVLLGQWQLRRLDSRRELNALIEARAAAPVADLGDLLPLGPEDGYRRVRASGTYDPQTEVIVLGTGFGDGRPGNRLLTALRTDAGVLVVDRGVVPPRMDRPPVRGAGPPSGRVEV